MTATTRQRQEPETQDGLTDAGTRCRTSWVRPISLTISADELLDFPVGGIALIRSFRSEQLGALETLLREAYGLALADDDAHFVRDEVDTLPREVPIVVVLARADDLERGVIRDIAATGATFVEETSWPRVLAELLRDAAAQGPDTTSLPVPIPLPSRRTRAATQVSAARS